MKKIFTLIAVAILFTVSFSASAQHPVIRAGFSYSQLGLTKDGDKSKLDLGSFSGFHVGIGYQTASALGFTFQPELFYIRKGNRIDKKITWNLNYLELPLNVQWGPDLVVCRPYIQVSPFIGYAIGNKVKTNINDLDPIINDELSKLTKNANRFEYGIAVGGGVEFMKRLQLSVKYGWNFGNVTSLDEYWQSIKGIKKTTAGCLDITLGFMF
ncbi:MAG: PorT family protein [Bacteroidales bacterium]|nr:PorT family protein [Bacteroidales bacterium]